MTRRGAPHGIQVASDHSKTKICDACTTGVIHENVWLAGCQNDGEMKFRTRAYPLEITVNDVVGMEIVKALHNVTQLVGDKYLAWPGEKNLRV